MNHDDAMWNIMGQNFCSFKVKTHDEKVRFCRNPYNVTGLCQRGVCPLSNSQYATVIQHEDELYLYIKTAERAHLPRRQWEKVKLDVNFPKALAQIDDELQWWDQKIVNKVKARLLRLKQYLMRKRKMLMQPKVQYVSVNKRLEDKLLRRQQKAEAAARIQLQIEKQLLDRLRKGTYDSVINYNKQAFEKFLDQQEDHAQFDELQHEQDEELPQFVMEDDEEDEQDEEDVDEEYSDDNDTGKTATNARMRTSKATHRTIGLKRKGVEREKLMIEEEVEREVPARQRIRSEDLDW